MLSVSKAFTPKMSDIINRAKKFASTTQRDGTSALQVNARGGGRKEGRKEELERPDWEQSKLLAAKSARRPIVQQHGRTAALIAHNGHTAAI